MNVHGLKGVRHTEIHTAESLVTETNAFEFKLAIEKLRSHKCPSIDKIQTQLIKAGGRAIRIEIHKLIISIWYKEELPEQWKESIIVPINKKGDRTCSSNYKGISLLPTMNKISSIML